MRIEKADVYAEGKTSVLIFSRRGAPGRVSGRQLGWALRGQEAKGPLQGSEKLLEDAGLPS